MDTLLKKKCVGWDTANWGRALEFWLENCELRQKRVLELGCGCDNGGLSLWAALNDSASVVCSDYDFPRLATREIHKQNGFSDFAYERIDARNIPFENEFDVIIFKSMLGGIVRGGKLEIAREVFSQVAKALKKDGMILFAENLVSTRFHRFLRNHCGAGKNNWRYFDNDELSEILASVSGLKLVARKNVGFLGCFGLTETQRFLLGQVDKMFLEHIVPEKFRYVQFLVARKI